MTSLIVSTVLLTSVGWVRGGPYPAPPGYDWSKSQILWGQYRNDEAGQYRTTAPKRHSHGRYSWFLQQLDEQARSPATGFGVWWHGGQHKDGVLPPCWVWPIDTPGLLAVPMPDASNSEGSQPSLPPGYYIRPPSQQGHYTFPNYYYPPSAPAAAPPQER